MAARGLTPRGYGLLTAGGALLLAGLAADVTDLLRVAALLLTLPPAAIVTVARNRYRVSCRRRLEPPRIEAGSSARVTLRLTNVSRLPTAVLLAEDQLPAVLGGRPRFTLDRVEAGGERAAAYSVSAPVRGRFAIGPLTVRVTDPFGLCELTRSFAATDELVVTPQVMPLTPIRLSGEWTGGGEARAAAVSSVGEDDIATRPYRHGDDLRRVHWRATARIGELMVRREEQPWRNRAVIFLDSRLVAHRGEGSESSFEQAVAVAASVGVHLARRGWVVRLLRDDGEDTSSAVGATGEAAQLNRLADISGSRSYGLGVGAAALSADSAAGLIVAVCGALGPEDLPALTRARGSRQGIAVLLDVHSWAAATSARSTARPQAPHPPTAATAVGSPRSAKAGTAARLAFTAGAEHLAVAGWKVLPLGRGDDLAALWPTIGVTDPRAGRREPAGKRPVSPSSATVS